MKFVNFKEFSRILSDNDGISTLGKREEDAVALTPAVHFLELEFDSVDLEGVLFGYEGNGSRALLGDEEAVFESAVNVYPRAFNTSHYRFVSRARHIDALLALGQLVIASHIGSRSEEEVLPTGHFGVGLDAAHTRIEPFGNCAVSVVVEGVHTNVAESALKSVGIPSLPNGGCTLTDRVEPAGGIKIPAIETSPVGSAIHFYEDSKPEEIAKAILNIDLNQACDSRKLIDNLNGEFILNIKKLLEE